MTYRLVGLMACALWCWSMVASAAETLYNGIVLPEKWPPAGQVGGDPVAPPYLRERPAVVPIDVGRQLFIDDFLIESTTLTRTFHRPEPVSSNPVVKPDSPQDQRGKSPSAMVFSDGVWWDAKDQRFKMWYMGGLMQSTCYAESTDGFCWTKPGLDVVEPGTSIVVKEGRDSNTVWLDHRASDAQRRFKMFTVSNFQYVMRESGDGVRWSAPVITSPKINDRSTVFYNPFRKVWVLSVRSWGMPRSRKYREAPDLKAALTWEDGGLVNWTGADNRDPRHPDAEFAGIAPHLYNLDAVAYESVMLGLFSIWQGPDNAVCAERKIQKRNEVLVGFSRDGFHWDRPDRRPFLAVNPVDGAWNWGNVQSAGGGCLVVGDRLYFYYSGRGLSDQFWDGNASTGLAVLRRDGFASMDSGEKPGTLTTRPVRFSGKHLFVNADMAHGQMRVELLDEKGDVIPGFDAAASEPVTGDSTLTRVRFGGVDDLSALAGRTVRFRFTLTGGSLYAFWVSPDATGASHGYIAAGGPGYTGATDDAGSAAYDAAKQVAARK